MQADRSDRVEQPYLETPIEARAPLLRFRRFTVAPQARLILRGEEPVEIGDRAFDLLVLLLRRRGSIVSKAEIFRYVWPSTFVQEGSLRFHMVLLRRALGVDGALIRTVVGRGYLFAAEIDAPMSGRPTQRTGAIRGSDAIDWSGPTLHTA